MNETTGGSGFQGRARRSEYWKKVIFLYLITMFVALPMIVVPVCSAFDGSGMSEGGIASVVFGCLIALGCGIAMWPVTVRRLHDRDMSGWWILWFALLSCIPYLGWIAGIVQFVIVGCMDGMSGPNKYGPDPKGRVGMPSSNRPIVGIVNNNTNTVNAGAAESVEERLRKLDDLKTKGVVSESEYEEQRKKIISEI